MEKKLRQVTDNIHDTIYLSELESELISTPYFYRLHDIYQSSTVYMTFPSNRTKRYEHSVGTMEIASSMLYSSVSNASNDTRNELFKYLKKYFVEILDLAIMQSDDQVAPYFTKCRDQIGSLFDQDTTKNFESAIKENIKYALEEGCFIDSALEHFQYYPLDIEKESDLESIENVFLYRCLLQAVRIVALFHDVGHPPYSHIIESVIKELYNKYLNVDGISDWQKEQLKIFKKCIRPYIVGDSQKAYTCQAIYSKSSLIKAPLHERVGLSLIQSAINDVIPQIVIDTIDSDKKLWCKIASAIYYIMVVEFAIAILVEKNKVFESFHKIIDGIVDADRLDYIMRDSLNSGVDWGKIPYKRVINSAKLVYLKKNETGNIAEDQRVFVIAYPKKVADDIEDILLVRYKIFARINFHHRCMKTAVALQSAVKDLAEDYLESSNEEQCINPDINILWSALGTNIGDRKARVIQWNDSWLISVLHKSLVKLNTNKKKDKAEKYRVLKENLEEILLNKKRYFSLFKRGQDSKEFIEEIFKYAEIDDLKIEALRLKEAKKYFDNYIKKESDLLINPAYDGLDSVKRIEQLALAKSGDLGALWRPIPLIDKSVKDCIGEVLSGFKKDDEIADFKIIVNDGKEKTGLPMHTNLLDEIYLYDGNRSITFDDKVTLRSQIEAIERNVLWLYIYFVPPATCHDTNKINELVEKLIDVMAKEIGIKLKKRYEELFGRTL